MSIRARIKRMEKETTRGELPAGVGVCMIYVGDGKTEEEIQREIEANEVRLKRKYGTSRGAIYIRHWLPDPPPLPEYLKSRR